MNLTHKDYVAILEHYNVDVPMKQAKENHKIKRNATRNATRNTTRKRKGKRRTIVDKNKTRKLAEDVLAKKLCKCIKSVQSSFESRTRKNRNALQRRNKSRKQPLNEGAAIGICRKNIFKNRGIDFNRFVCKKRAKLIRDFKKKYALQKTRKEIF